MKKTLLASAIALSLSSVASVQAQIITITEMRFGASYGVTGTMNSNGDGQMVRTDNFSCSGCWTADQQNWFEAQTGTLTWSGTGTSADASNAIGDFSYNFTLTGNQVAAGAFFDWNGYYNIPVLTIYDCPITGGGVCNGVSLPMITGPSLGAAPKFNGTTFDDFPVSAVPIPAAVWLMGSGLIGLIGVARRKRL